MSPRKCGRGRLYPASDGGMPACKVNWASLAIFINQSRTVEILPGSPARAIVARGGADASEAARQSGFGLCGVRGESARGVIQRLSFRLRRNAGTSRSSGSNSPFRLRVTDSMEAFSRTGVGDCQVRVTGSSSTGSDDGGGAGGPGSTWDGGSGADDGGAAWASES